MPTKIRELIAELKAAGFIDRGGKETLFTQREFF